MITMVCVPVRKQRPQEGEGLVEVGLGQPGKRFRPWGEGKNDGRLGPGRNGQECLGEKSLGGGGR